MTNQRFIVTKDQDFPAVWGERWDTTDTSTGLLAGTHKTQEDAEQYAQARNKGGLCSIVLLTRDDSNTVCGSRCDCGGSWRVSQTPHHAPGCSHTKSVQDMFAVANA